MLASFEQVRVLLVDDDEDEFILIRAALREILGSKPSDLKWCSGYAEGLEALLRGQVDVCLLDYHLNEGRTGLDFLREVKERGILTPIILITGVGDAEIDRQAMEHGAADYLTKGRFEPIDLERAIYHALERSRTTVALMASDRMVTMGTLAAGVAHEINNPLAAMMCNLEILAGRLAELPADAAPTPAALREMSELLGDTHECAQRVSSIVRSLKMFSRVDEEALGVLDLRRVFESTLKLVWNEIRHRARLVKDYGPCPGVRGNEARVGQVFLNLLVNAAHAIPEGDADRHEIRVVTRSDDEGRAVVEIRDTGSGIPEHVRPRIFDPFFTTKPIGVGTGLGLSICQGIVASLRGTIEVESTVGVGTVFRITLPAAGQGPARAAVPSVAARPALPRGRVLIVDDEPLVAQALCRAIGAAHDVVIHTRRLDALRAIESGSRFDLVFCDVMMPELSVQEFYRRVGEAAPALLDRIVFMSGSAFTQTARAFLNGIPNERVDKPFNLARVRGLIESRLERNLGPRPSVA